MARKTCGVCKRPQSVCFCHLIKPVNNQWPINIIQHVEEVEHAIGTAKIAQLCLQNCQTRVIADSEEFKQDDGFEGVLVYPDENSISLSELKQLKQVQQKPLIFIDASWRKSKKIIFQSPYLQTLPRVSFSFPQPSRYRIRKQPEAGYCSTLEAMVHILAELEEDEEKYDDLLKIMDWMIDQQLAFINKSKS